MVALPANKKTPKLYKMPKKEFFKAIGEPYKSVSGSSSCAAELWLMRHRRPNSIRRAVRDRRSCQRQVECGRLRILHLGNIWAGEG
jgi:hypothetical protein